LHLDDQACSTTQIGFDQLFERPRLRHHAIHDAARSCSVSLLGRDNVPALYEFTQCRVVPMPQLLTQLFQLYVIQLVQVLGSQILLELSQDLTP
jgi:hypothetical protein